MANDKYILSNDYFVEIQKLGPQKTAVLFTPQGQDLFTGPSSLTAPVLTLVNQVIKEYTPEGRLDDPARWANVPTVVREEVAPKDVVSRVQGSVIDQDTGEAISGAKVTLGTNKTTSDSRGIYRFKITLKDGEPAPSSITITKSGYAPISGIPAIKQDGSLKSSINIVTMDTLNKSLEKEEAEIKVLEENTINKVKKFDTKSIEAKVIDTVNKEVSNLLERAVPFALNILAAFGISKISEAENKSCPTLPNISGVINQKNKLTRQLNNSFGTIKSVSSTGNLLSNLIKVAKVVSKLIKKNPIPSTLGTPPGPQGGVIKSTSLGKITTIDEKREKVDKLIEKLDNVSKALVPAVIPMVDTLGKLTSILSTIDTFCGECLDDVRQAVVDEINRQQGLDTNQTGSVGLGQAGVNVVDIDFSQIDESRLKNILGIDQGSEINVGDLLAGNYLQEQLDQELTSLTAEEAEDGQPSVTEYNGFVISVETESEEAAQGKSIKRRFAVGKDQNGVRLIQGEKSYSSNDQVLINELIFTIEQEGLTPN